MYCTFYNTNDAFNNINKTLENSVSAVCDIIQQTSISDLTIIVKSDYINKNYVYINDLNRYYFVKDIEISNSMIVMHLHIDVLYTYRNEILQSNFYLSRVEDYAFTDVPDNLLQVSNKSVIDCKRISDDIITRNFTYILGVR